MLYLIIIWAICGFFGYGITLAYFEGEFSFGNNYRENLGFSTFVALCGPLGLLSIILMTGFCKHGFRLK